MDLFQPGFPPEGASVGHRAIHTCTGCTPCTAHRTTTSTYKAFAVSGRACGATLYQSISDSGSGAAVVDTVLLFIVLGICFELKVR